MSEMPTAVDRALTGHDAFVRIDEGFDLSTTVFDTCVTATDGDGRRDGVFTVTMCLPTLSAAAEEVAPVVEDDWYHTFRRRLADAFSVVRATTHEGPTVERDGESLVVTATYVAWDAAEGVEDAKTLLEYVEGTYAQGLIPGYDYHGGAATLLEGAHSRGEIED